MSSPTLTLALHCMHCGRPVTVEYTPKAVVELGIAPPAWPCPHYHCPGSNMLVGVQEVVAVWKGHGPKPTSAPLAHATFLIQAPLSAEPPPN